MEATRHPPGLATDASQLPFRPDIPISVFVLGSGIAGCTAAWLLAEAGFGVTVVECMAEPFASTSIGALGIHLGGRYPDNWRMARQYLRAATVLKRLMPFAFRARRLRFIIPDRFPLTFSEYVSFYRKLQEYYASLPQSGQLFGEPNAFFSMLTHDNLRNFRQVAGGIVSQEPCFDMPKVRTTLLRTLAARNVTVQTSSEVLSIIARQPSGYRIRIRDLTRQTVTDAHADIVIDATGASTSFFDQTIGRPPARRLDLRFFHDIQLDDEAAGAYPFPFVVPRYMHFVPLSESTASLVGFGKDRLDRLVFEKGQPVPTATWREPLLTRNISTASHLAAAILQAARRELMPKLGNATTIRTYPGVSVSTVRGRPLGVWSPPDAPGYFSINPSKASQAAVLALEVLQRTIDYCFLSKHLTALSEYTRSISADHVACYLEE